MKMRGDTTDPTQIFHPMWPHAQHINQGQSCLGAAAQEPSRHHGGECVSLVLYMLILLSLLLYSHPFLY